MWTLSRRTTGLPHPAGRNPVRRRPGLLKWATAGLRLSACCPRPRWRACSRSPTRGPAAWPRCGWRRRSRPGGSSCTPDYRTRDPTPRWPRTASSRATSSAGRLVQGKIDGIDRHLALEVEKFMVMAWQVSIGRLGPFSKGSWPKRSEGPAAPLTTERDGYLLPDEALHPPGPAG